MYFHRYIDTNVSDECTTSVFRIKRGQQVAVKLNGVTSQETVFIVNVLKTLNLTRNFSTS